MSSYHSDKCTEKELLDFKADVSKWLTDNFGKVKTRCLSCYGGEIRIYFGSMEVPNRKKSFRRTEPDLNERGEIVGYTGTRGIHMSKIADYVSITRDELEKVKKLWNDKEKSEDTDEWLFYNDFLFRKLPVKEKA